MEGKGEEEAAMKGRASLLLEVGHRPGFACLHRGSWSFLYGSLLIQNIQENTITLAVNDIPILCISYAIVFVSGL